MRTIANRFNSKIMIPFWRAFCFREIISISSVPLSNIIVLLFKGVVVDTHCKKAINNLGKLIWKKSFFL